MKYLITKCSQLERASIKKEILLLQALYNFKNRFEIPPIYHYLFAVFSTTAVQLQITLN
jgi:hypothetical protein